MITPINNIKHIKDTINIISNDIDIIHTKIKETRPFMKIIMCGMIITMTGKLVNNIYNKYIETEKEICVLKCSIEAAYDIATQMYNKTKRYAKNDTADNAYKIITSCVQTANESVKKPKHIAVYELRSLKITIKNFMYVLDYLINTDNLHSTAHIDNL